jgi:hypothetical protein
MRASIILHLGRYDVIANTASGRRACDGALNKVEADMVRMTILAALALVVLVRPSAAAEPGSASLIKVADLDVSEAPVHRRHVRHHHVRYFRYNDAWYDYPGACSAVVFPRSPLCGGPTYPYYFGPFWVW